MGLFNKKKQPSAEVSSPAGMDMTPMVTMLAAAPEEQRRQMLTDRLAVFAAQDETIRAKGMGAMLTAALALPDDDYTKIAASRLNVLLGMSPEQRMTLMQTHAAAVKGLDGDQRGKEIRTMRAVIGELPEPQREMVMGMMQKLGMMP